MSKSWKLACIPFFGVLFLTLCWIGWAENHYAYRVAAYHWYTRSPNLYYTNSVRLIGTQSVKFKEAMYGDSMVVKMPYKVTPLR